MKSVTRTVLDEALTSAMSYSSGALFVGDLYELAIDVHITSATGGSDGYTFNVSRIAADGSLHGIGSIISGGSTSLSIGSGLNGNAFGDQVQIDLLNPGGYTLTGNVSVLGK